jgi:hypothetical protein
MGTKTPCRSVCDIEQAKDLKDLLALVVVTIQSELLFEALKKDMPSGKP